MAKSKAGSMVPGREVPDTYMKDTYMKIRNDGADRVIHIFDRNGLRRGASVREGLSATIWVKYPNDGAGNLKVVAAAWPLSTNTEVAWFYNSVGGYGYDKLAAALQGFSFLTADGESFVTLGNHPHGPTLDHKLPAQFEVLG